MCTLTRSLLVLAAAALLQGACAAPQTPDQCTTVESGTEDGREVHLPDTQIDRNTQDAEITIPNGCQWNEIMSGERVTVCDDVPPVVILPPWPEYGPVTVHRRGAYWNDVASVYITQWCVPVLTQ